MRIRKTTYMLRPMIGLSLREKLIFVFANIGKRSGPVTIIVPNMQELLHCCGIVEDLLPNYLDRGIRVITTSQLATTSPIQTAIVHCDVDLEKDINGQGSVGSILRSRTLTFEYSEIIEMG